MATSALSTCAVLRTQRRQSAFNARRSFVYLCFLPLAGVVFSFLLGCSSEPMSADNESDAGIAEVERMRVIVTLNPSEDGIDTAVEHLQRQYPQAKVLRKMAGFSQVVLELPSDQLKSLRNEENVRAATADKLNHTNQDTP